METGAHMKKIAITLLIVLSLAFTANAENKIVAKVNEHNIYESEIRSILNQFLANNGIEPSKIDFYNPQLTNYKKDILKRLIERQLLYTLASQNISDDIDKKVQDILTKIQQKYPSEKDFENALSASGTNSEELRLKFRKKAIIEDYLISLSNNIKISDQEISNFYEKNKKAFNTEEKIKASHILIEIKGAIDADSAKIKIDKVYKKLQEDEEFAELARKYSTGPSGKDGGDLGYFRRQGDMVEKFAATAFSMKIGEISKPIRTKFGYHIIKVIDHKPAKSTSLQEATDKITNILKDKKVKEIILDNTADMKAKSTIETFI